MRRPIALLLLLPAYAACSRADADSANARPYGVGIADRGYLLVKGRIAKSGPAAELLASAETRGLYL